MLTKLLTRSVPFTFNRYGYYYFSRRVPADLLQHYTYPRVVQSLKTKSAHTAKTRAFVAAAKLDEYWSHLRMTDADLFGRNLLKPGYRSFSTNTQLNVSMELEQSISLADALKPISCKRVMVKDKLFIWLVKDRVPTLFMPVDQRI